MDDDQLRHAAYAVLEPHLSSSRESTVDRFRHLRGTHDDRAATEAGDLAAMALDGRIDTLLIAEPACTASTLAEEQDSPSVREINSLVRWTLSRSGSVQVVPSAVLEEQSVAAILRF